MPFLKNGGDRPSNYIDAFNDRDRFQQLMQFLDRFMADSQGYGSSTTIVNNINQGGGGTSGNTPGGGNAPSAPPPGSFVAPACPDCFPGAFVHFTARDGPPTMFLADNRDGQLWATHYVVDLQQGNATLMPIWTGQVFFPAGRGLDDNPIFWIYQEGRVTDDISDLIDPDGNAQPGVIFSQEVAYRADSKSAGQVLASINISQPTGTGGAVS